MTTHRHRQRQSPVRHIGIISDTHGLLRPEALAALRDSDLIVHAGDVGDPAVLEALRMIAPVVAVRGNNDTGSWARALAERETFRAGTHVIHVLHDRGALALDTGVRVDAVISGHSHKPAIGRAAGVLFVNPGSAGPRRFRLPVTIARIDVTRAGLRPRIVELAPVLGLGTRPAE